MNGLNGRLYYPNEKLRLIPFVNITRSGNKVGGRRSPRSSSQMLHEQPCRMRPAPPCVQSSAPLHAVLTRLLSTLPSLSPRLQGESFKVMVDINTPGISGVMEMLRAAGDTVIKSSPTEFNGVLAVHLREGGSPLKMTISVRSAGGRGG